MLIDFSRDITGESNEREAIFVSGSPLKTAKLFGVPCLPNATGEAQQQENIKVLHKWKIYRPIGMVFDTTSSNTGQFKGAAALMEIVLKNAIFWLSCRHHVYEVHIKHAADLLLGQRNLPSIALFRRFKEIYPELDNDLNNYCTLDHSILIIELEEVESLLKWAEESLSNNTFPREDYHDLLELTVVFLGGNVPRGFTMQNRGLVITLVSWRTPFTF